MGGSLESTSAAVAMSIALSSSVMRVRMSSSATWKRAPRARSPVQLGRVSAARKADSTRSLIWGPSVGVARRVGRGEVVILSVGNGRQMTVNRGKEF